MTQDWYTLRDFIRDLKALPDNAQIRGLDFEIQSWRWDYEENSVKPLGDGRNAHRLAAALEAQEGLEMTGYKGGTFVTDLDKRLAVAHYGEVGEVVVGIEHENLGPYSYYRPILEEVSW